MKLKSVLIGSAAAGALLVAAPAYADSTYVSFFGGINSLDADDLTFGPFTSTTSVVNIGFFISATNTGSGTLKFWTDVGYAAIVGSGSFFATAPGTRFAGTYVNSFRESEFDTGFVVGAALGRDFQDGWRAELEVAWRSGDIGENHAITGTQSSFSRRYITRSGTGSLKFYTLGGSLTGSGYYPSTAPFFSSTTATFTKTQAFSATAVGDGEVTSFAIMANVWYDWDFGDGSPIKPFVGAGVGAVNLGVDYTARAVLPANTVGSLSAAHLSSVTATFATDTDEWTWGWQAAAGISYEFSGGMRLSAQYRYFSTGDIDVLGQDFSVSSHEGLVGLHIPLGN